MKCRNCGAPWENKGCSYCGACHAPSVTQLPAPRPLLPVRMDWHWDPRHTEFTIWEPLGEPGKARF